MKRITCAAFAVLITLLFAACNSQPDTLTETTLAPTQTESSSESTTKKSQVAYGSVDIQEETVQKTDVKKKKVTKPEATEATESTAPTTMPPTQGVTKAGRQIVVTTVVGSLTSTDLDFVYGSATIKLNERVEEVFTSLGRNDYEAPEKKKNVYDFEEFIMNSYVEDGIERIDKITVTDENYSTAKGAKIGMYASQLRRIYGDADKVTTTEYIFGSSTKTLTFTYEDNIVTGISYNLDH